MKIRNYKIKNLTISICAIIFAVGVLLGVFLIRKEYINKLNNMQEQLKTTQEDLRTYQEAYEEAWSSAQYEYAVNELLEMELANAQEIIYNLKNTEYEIKYLGDYTLTHYCVEESQHICGEGTGLTATGSTVTVGRTIAVDPSVIPYGTKVYIEGYGWRVAEDCGGAVNGQHIDIAVETHTQALSMGTTAGGVWILVEKSS